jgi:hypothetical protein
MRRRTVEALGLVLVLVSFDRSLGQQTPPPAQPASPAPGKDNTPAEKSKLEDMLTEALRNNPDIRVAVATVAKAEAELNRTRFQVTQQVIALHGAWTSQIAMVKFRQKQYERYKELAKSNAIDQKLLQEAEDRLAADKAKLAEIEAQIPGLLGKAPATEEVHGVITKAGNNFMVKLDVGGKRLRQEWGVVGRTPSSPQAEQIRQALQKPIQVNFQDVKLPEVLQELEKLLGVSFLDRYSIYGPAPLTLRLRWGKEMPAASVLQALEDVVPPGPGGSLRFVVRDYGILATSESLLPPGAATVQGFLKQQETDKARDKGTTP